MKKIIFMLACSFLFWYSIVQATVQINEVQISPSEDRFIELYNSGNETIDLTDWYLQRKTATGTSFSSLVTKSDFENQKISAGEYFLIGRLTGDLIIDDLTLTESNALQLKNSAGEIVSSLAWGSSNECFSDCPDNPSEGESIQIQNDNSWVIANPTPGESNNYLNDLNLDSEDFSDSSFTEDAEIEESEDSSIQAEIITNSITFAGQPTLFQVALNEADREKLFLGKAYWNFGDGSSSNQLDDFSSFNHIYYYPGEYLVSVEYYLSSFSSDVDATDNFLIKVLSPTIRISKVGNSKDFFVELTNDTSATVNLSSWYLKSNNKVFYFPKNSYLSSNKSLILSGRVTGFLPGDEKNLLLFLPNGELVTSYQNNYLSKSSTKIGANSFEKNSNLLGNTLSENDLSFDNFLTAQANQNLDLVEDTKTINWYFVIFVLLLGIAGGIAYFIRRKKNFSPGDDFKIIDE